MSQCYANGFLSKKSLVHRYFLLFFLSEKKKRKLRGLLTENCEDCPWFETPKIAKTKNAGAKIAGSRCIDVLVSFIVNVQ